MMNLASKTALAAAVIFALGACGRTGNSDGQPADNAAGIDAMTNTMIADAANPFAQSEIQMSEKMTTAVGTSVADNWVRKMIEHHQGALDMSRIMLELNPSAQAAKMARSTIAKQSKEILDLRRLIQEGTPDQASAALYRPAMTSMHEAMMAAKGADVSETFLRKMLEHHKGAIAMSDVALTNGVAGKVRAEIKKTRADQQQEAAMVERMLGGKAMAGNKDHAAGGPKAAQGNSVSSGMPVPGTNTPEHIVVNQDAANDSANRQ